MNAPGHLEEIVAEARYARERLSLLKAKAYGGKATSSVRLREFERALQSAERRLREARQREQD